MKKTLATVVLTMGAVAMLAGCGSTANSSSDNATNSTSAQASASGVSAALKQQFVSVNGAAQTAIDDFNAGSSIEGDMDTATIGGQTYSVVATSQSGLNTLKTRYQDFMTSDAVNTLFKDVVQKGNKYVLLPATQKDDLNWYKATVSDAKSQGNGSYVVTLSVPNSQGAATTKQVKMQNDAQGHLVYAGLAN